MLQKGGMMSHLRSPRRRAAAGFAAISAGLAVAAVAFANPAAATWEPDKTRVPGNPSCEDLGYENSFKIDRQPESGTYTSASPGVETVGDADGFEVDVVVSSHAGRMVVEFESNHPVDVVVIKAGPEAYVYYENSDPVTASAPHHYLKSPKRDSISHVTFCWNGEGPGEETPPTTEPEEEPPPTTEPEHEHPTTTVPVDEPEGEDEDEGDGEGDDEDEAVAPVTQTPPATPVSGTPILTG
jgi:hypothetical protein